MESPTENDDVNHSTQVRKGFTLRNSFSLSMLTLSFVVGEISHFLIGVVSQEMARSLHYGDKVCNLQHSQNNSDSNQSKSIGRTNAECEKFSIDSCHMHQGETIASLPGQRRMKLIKSLISCFLLWDVSFFARENKTRYFYYVKKFILLLVWHFRNY